MKLLEISRSFYPSIGGLEKFVDARLKIYEALNLGIELLTTNFSTEKKKYFYEDNIKITRLRQYTPYSIVFSNLKKIISKFDIVSVNQVGNYLSDFSIIAANQLGKQIIITPHMFFHTDRFRAIKNFYENIFLQKIFSLGHRIICFTGFEKKYWTSKYPELEKKLDIIPHYFNQNKVQQSIDRGFLFYLGRYHKNKKNDLLIKAFSSFDIRGLDLIMTVNYDDLDNELKGIVAFDNRIKLIGNINDFEKEKLLSSCSALIVPSTYEAFGIANFEASAYSKPLICTNLDVFNEVLNPMGVIYFENTVDSLRDAIRRFYVLSKKDKVEMGRYNKERLFEFSFDNAKKKYKKLFQEIDIEL